MGQATAAVWGRRAEDQIDARGMLTVRRLETSSRRAVVAVGKAAVGTVGELAVRVAIEALAVALGMTVELFQQA